MKDIQISRVTLANIIFGTLLAGVFLSPIIYSGFRNTVTDDFSSARAIPEKDQAAAIALQRTFINVFKAAQPSVVYIRTNVLVRPNHWFEVYRQVEGAGSGFLIDKEGYIVTNNHVVAGARKIEVIFSDQRTVEAKLIGRDESSDIALIKVPASDSLVPIKMGDSDTVEPGQLAFALGSPFGLENTFTMGVISAEARKVDNSRYSRIQTDASINPGNSGGPLLNIRGEVIGINQSIISPSGRAGGSVGIGFAIPINEAKSIIEQLKTEKRIIGRPALGLTVVVPAASYREYLGVGDRDGIVVRIVVPGSAAEEAGLRENDFIYEADGEEISDPDDLNKIVQKLGVGAKITLKIIRNRKEMTITAVIGEDISGR